MDNEIKIINKLVENVKLKIDTTDESGIAMSPNGSVTTKVQF